MRREQVVWERGGTDSPLTHTGDWGARGKAELLDSLRAAEHSSWAPPASWGFCTVVMNGLWVLTGKRGLLRKPRPTFWLRSHMEEGSAECVHQSLPKLSPSTTLKWIILRTSKIFFFGGERGTLCSLCDLSSPIRDWTRVHTAWHLNQWTARQLPKILLKALDIINWLSPPHQSSKVGRICFIASFYRNGKREAVQGQCLYGFLGSGRAETGTQG